MTLDRDRLKKLPVPSLDPSFNLKKLVTPHAFEGTQTTGAKLGTDGNQPITYRTRPGTTKFTHYQNSTVTSDDGGVELSPVPPSYRSTHLEAAGSYHVQVSQPLTNRLVAPVNTDIKKAKDLDDAWKNIKMAQDEKFADKFREDMLIARCWEIWRQGFLWILVCLHLLYQCFSY